MIFNPKITETELFQEKLSETYWWLVAITKFVGKIKRSLGPAAVRL
jgi:hypothetical protein